MRRLMMTAFAASILFSCTVKEERSGCPCLLNLDFDEVIEDGRYAEAVTTIGASPDSPLEQELLLIAPYQYIGYEVSVPRVLVNTSVVCGCQSGKVSEECVTVGTDPVWAFAMAVHCRNDRENVDVRLHKQYCRLTLVPEGMSADEKYPFELRVNAATDALRLYDLEPCGEAFTISLQDDLSVNLPRQSSDAVLTIDMMDGGEEPVFSVDLSSKLSEAGYDWDAEDLADVSVSLDFAHMICSVTILPWGEDGEYRHIEI